MSTAVIVALVVVFALVIAARRRRGPRVTEITRTVTHEKEDGGDA